jgi:hypothetical protein
MFNRRVILCASLAFIFVASLLLAGFTVLKAQADTLPSGTKWYFAEGRIGKGFRQYLTIANPNSFPCSIQVEYLYTRDSDNQSNTKIINLSVAAQSRTTESVNADLSIPDSMVLGATDSIIANVSQSNCKKLVFERPMYFQNFNGVSSGTDVIGATTLGTSFELADVPTGSAGKSWITILNPQSVSANVTATYYANGQVQNTQTLLVPPLSRATFQPGNLSLSNAHVGATITSDQSILVERPSYYPSINGISGASDVIAVPAASTTWYFPEGNTQNNYNTQENLFLANPSGTDTKVNITLFPETNASSIITSQSVSNISIPAYSQVIWNVNANNTFTGHTSNVGIKVDGSSSVVVEREIAQIYQGINQNTTNWQANSVSDSMGVTTVSTTEKPLTYSFAEGYGASGYNEWLSLLNTDTALNKDGTGGENISITLTNTASSLNEIGNTYTYAKNIGIGRTSINITELIEQHMVSVGDAKSAYEVAMTVSSDGGSFIAERTMEYHPTNGYVVQGSNTVIGYTGQ